MHNRRMFAGALCFLVFLTVANVAAVAGQRGIEVTICSDTVDAGSFPALSLPVSVVNANGVPILGLRDNDFEAFEDGFPLKVGGVSEAENQDLSMAVALVLDLSGSAPIEEIQSAAKEFINTLGVNDRVALIGFNEQLSFTDFDPNKEVDFTTDHNGVKNVIDNLKAAGNSAVYEAIYKAVLMTAEETADRRALIVMTDGYDTISRAEIATADTPRTAAKENGIPIFTVGVYNPNPDYGSNPNYLSVLARETGGHYEEVTDLNRLGALFSSAARQLRIYYQVQLRSGLEVDGKDHTLRMRVTTAAGEGQAERVVTYPSAPDVPEITGVLREVDNALVAIETPLRRKVLLVPQIAALNPMERVEYWVDDSLLYTALAEYNTSERFEPWEWEWNTSGMGPGTHTLEVRAFDNAGNASVPYTLEIETADGSAGSSTWIILVVVGAILLLGVALYFILRRSSSPPELDQDWTANTQSAVPATDVAVRPIFPPTDAFPVPSPEPDSRETPSYKGTKADYSRTGVIQSSESAQPLQEATPYVVGGDTRMQAANKTVGLKRQPEKLAWLVVQKGPSVSAGHQFRLQDLTSIGRRADNDIVLDDPAISRQHAKIRLRDGVFELADLGAANPTLVNGQEVVRHTLTDGDRVEIGSTVLVFKEIKAQ